MQDPDELIAPFVTPGMTVLEPGPGMGFFTLPLARHVGSGRVIAVDVQPKMLSALRRRAAKAGLLQRIETRLAKSNSLGVDDLNGTVDFVLAVAVVHEMPSPETFFGEAAGALRPGGKMLFAEPSGHVDKTKFNEELNLAGRAGLAIKDLPQVKRFLAAVLAKEAG